MESIRRPAVGVKEVTPGCCAEADFAVSGLPIERDFLAFPDDSVGKSTGEDSSFAKPAAFRFREFEQLCSESASAASLSPETLALDSAGKAVISLGSTKEEGLATMLLFARAPT